MKRFPLATVTLLLSIGLLGAEASAQGLLGKRYLALSIGQIVPGNDTAKEIDDAIVKIGVDFNYPVNKNFDLFAALGYTQAKGDFEGAILGIETTTKEIDLGVAYQFYPGEALNPFVSADAGWVRTESDNSSGMNIEGYDESGTSDDVAFNFAGGIEAPFAEKFAARPSIAFHQLKDESDFSADINVNGWFNQYLFAGLGASYWFDEGDFRYAGTIGFSF